MSLGRGRLARLLSIRARTVDEASVAVAAAQRAVDEALALKTARLAAWEQAVDRAVTRDVLTVGALADERLALELTRRAADAIDPIVADRRQKLDAARATLCVAQREHEKLVVARDTEATRERATAERRERKLADEQAARRARSHA
jgi:flagellar biosynthesis chaperone FliJ